MKNMIEILPEKSYVENSLLSSWVDLPRGLGVGGVWCGGRGG